MNVILITGCSSGFGFLAAKKLAARGDQVFATMRAPGGKNSGPAEELRALSNIEVLDLDVTSNGSVDAAAAVVLAKADAPDVIINNAGQMYVGLAEAFTAEELSRQLDVNVVGIHRVNRAFLPSMRQRAKGLIINVSSVAGRMAAPFFAVYHASKWGVEGYSLALRRELACVGVDVVVVEPGPFTTKLFPQSPRPKDEDNRTQSYPKVAQQTFDSMGAAFEGMFSDPEVPTDPIDVVNRFIELIDMAAGTRPFRSVVGVDMGVTERNATDEAHEGPFLQMMGIEEFVQLRTT
ncbi:MAG: SDR family NAD(P)-dependent oxidoreductase [Planctomycetota bacterium]|jgi:NAD(P)-dependent dehydrogenase (short-subunit alcohol dehydrogenase family)